MTGIVINTEVLYSATERDYARAAFIAAHPDGPTWGAADQRTRGTYLEQAGIWYLRQLAYELAYRPQPQPRGVLAWIKPLLHLMTSAARRATSPPAAASATPGRASPGRR